MNKKLQVFVSSTYTDLKEERQAAVQAILDAGHIPAGMELFKAGNESQLKTIYKWIDESDVYMLILGGRYGTIEKQTGKSYTQLEYEYALSKDIPVFSVVLSQSFLTAKINSLGLNNILEQAAPSKYQAFKSIVMSKIIREVDDCKDIKIVIHSTLNEFLNEYELTGWVRNDIEKESAISYKNNHPQKELQHLQNKPNIPYNTLSVILSLIHFYYKDTRISALNFFTIFYEKHLSKYCFSIYDNEYYIFSFLQEMNLVEEIDHIDSNQKHVEFKFTQYGISFYNIIKSRS